MRNNPTEWTLDGFVDHFDFVHNRMLDHKFVWVLGAGASLASNIPLGSHLVDRWLKKMHVREEGTKTTLEKWATAERLGIPGFKFEERASYYPKIYERCFREYPEEGYAFLESVMSGKDPSPGYSILAAALAADPSRHNVVVTTNFDNLVADALSIYTDTFPFVCGHESLTTFVRVAMRRPLICKIHRDLLLGPQNDPRSLRRLHDAWGIALRALFQHYTPLFIGYGGNDDTLMDLLESLQPDDIKGQLIWCYHEGGKPSDRIQNLIADLNGVLVPVPDFDLLMVLLGEKMGIGLMDQEIEKRSKSRTDQYRNRIQKLDTIEHPSVTRALAATFERSGGWWAWFQKAQLEKDPARKEVVLRQGLEHCPKSLKLHNNFAVFLWEELGKAEEAEIIFKKAIEINPRRTKTLLNYVEFLLANHRLKDASKQIKRGKLLLNQLDVDVDADGGSNKLILAWFSLLLSILTRIDTANAKKSVKQLLSEGERYPEWTFDKVLQCVRKKLTRQQFALLKSFTVEINTQKKQDREIRATVDSEKKVIIRAKRT